MPAVPAHTGVSTCKDCGETMYWARRNDGSGRKHPPLERYYPEDMLLYIDDAGIVQPVSGLQLFRKHKCTPVDIDLV